MADRDLRRRRELRCCVVLTAAILAGCGRTAPTATAPTEALAPLPLVLETASMRYYHAPGDAIEFERQEAFNAWALARLAIQTPRAVEYRKYASADLVVRYTGRSCCFAEPDLLRIHTVLPFDNHEIVHVYAAAIGRPSDFFSEGLAVSFQVDPLKGDFTMRLAGHDVNEACRAALAAGTLPLPLSTYVTTDGFRAIGDAALAYRTAGSFVHYLTQQYGLPNMLEFYRTSARQDTADAIRARMRATLGVDLDQAEAGWLRSLRQ